METRTYDLLVIGGGINGTGIARAAAGRGLAVLLVEHDDPAAHPSSQGPQPIHRGPPHPDQPDFRPPTHTHTSSLLHSTFLSPASAAPAASF